MKVQKILLFYSYSASIIILILKMLAGDRESWGRNRARNFAHAIKYDSCLKFLSEFHHSDCFSPRKQTLVHMHYRQSTRVRSTFMPYVLQQPC